jgi:L-rhamnose-H+ transport protein
MIRYLGIGLGLAIGCGICSSVGTLVPPIASGHAADLVKDTHAVLTLCGVVATLVGIAFVGAAGHRKSRELTGEAARKAVAEFDFKKGIWIAIFSGLMSAGMNFGLQGGIDLESAALAAGTASRWRGLPVQSLVLGGGFLVNAAWCIGKGVRQGSLGELRSGGANWLFAALAGIVWAMSATMMKVGEPLMGDMRYISFAVIMSSTVFFSTLFGIFSGEWKGTNAKTKAFLAVGIIILLSAFSVISMGKAT